MDALASYLEEFNAARNAALLALEDLARAQRSFVEHPCRQTKVALDSAVADWRRACEVLDKLIASWVKETDAMVRANESALAASLPAGTLRNRSRR